MQYINTQVNETAVEFNITGEMFFLKQSSAPVQVAFNNKENGFITLQQGEKVFLQFDKLYIKTLQGVEDISFITSSSCNGDIEGKKFEEKANRVITKLVAITETLTQVKLKIADRNPYRKSLTIYPYQLSNTNQFFISDNPNPYTKTGEFQIIGDNQYTDFAGNPYGYGYSNNAGLILEEKREIKLENSISELYLIAFNSAEVVNIIYITEETSYIDGGIELVDIDWR